MCSSWLVCSCSCSALVTTMQRPLDELAILCPLLVLCVLFSPALSPCSRVWHARATRANSDLTSQAEWDACRNRAHARSGHCTRSASQIDTDPSSVPTAV
jgi:hypothetical protein